MEAMRHKYSSRSTAYKDFTHAYSEDSGKVTKFKDTSVAKAWLGTNTKARTEKRFQALARFYCGKPYTGSKMANTNTSRGLFIKRFCPEVAI